MSNEQNAVKEFTKRPVTIQAIQWTGDNLHAVITFMEGAVVTNNLASAARWDDYRDLVEKRGLIIKTLEGQHIASVGDWIIKGVKGEHYPCKPDIFEMTYAQAQQSAPAGYVMVPVDMTQEMYLVFCEERGKHGGTFRSAYKAMLAAAPKAEQPPVQCPAYSERIVPASTALIQWAWVDEPESTVFNEGYNAARRWVKMQLEYAVSKAPQPSDDARR